MIVMNIPLSPPFSCLLSQLDLCLMKTAFGEKTVLRDVTLGSVHAYIIGVICEGPELDPDNPPVNTAVDPQSSWSSTISWLDTSISSTIRTVSLSECFTATSLVTCVHDCTNFVPCVTIYVSFSHAHVSSIQGKVNCGTGGQNPAWRRDLGRVAVDAT